jgi:hypothetical protein
MATSSGAKKANYVDCTLKDGVPTGSEYGSKPTAPQPKRLTLPAGNKDNQGEHKDKLN